MEKSMRYFYIDPARMDGDRVKITGEEARHIARVVRLHKDDRIHLLDGCGKAYEGIIRDVSAAVVTVDITGQRSVDTESPLAITVAQALIKDRKMDRLIRQLTEVGVTRWIPFSARRSVARMKTTKIAARLQRWEKISLAAVKQCRRGRPMRIEAPMDFQSMLAASETADLKLIFWEQAAFGRGVPVVQMPSPRKHCFLAVGPEGGFDETEMQAARRAGFVPLSLGPRILRAETAALAAAVLVQHWFGDLGEKIA
jgi:16S rRNA (uracil1498-N3)-methyltransferase